ncbi:MAG: hypothetical protein DRH11_14290 [Deltaproteobacteria bacterium]|nr:MAG: hypothetical protein DRH11_14290 [Deltaproteobacteria bacterium]
MKDFMSVSPLKILEFSTKKDLGPGHLGVLIARAGVGKTACLIHIALDRIFRGEKLVHVSLEEEPEKVVAYYNVIYSDLVRALGLEIESGYRDMVDRNRVILAYLNQSFELNRLKENIKNLAENMDFSPDVLLVDGIDFEKMERSILEGFKEIAGSYGIEIWFSALSHRHITEVNERGIPYPCNLVDDLFSIIIQLQPESTGVFLKLLKDHESTSIPDAKVRLDPESFLAVE